MVALAAASTANIGKWLQSTGENVVTAWGVAVAVGAMVVTLSVILSRVDRGHSPALFRIMVIAAGAMCLLSGTLQMMAYDLHMALWRAALLGYLLPLCGELLVGVAMSLYATYQDEMVLITADSESDRQIEQLIADEMRSLDLSEAKEYMQRKANTLARRKIDGTFARIMARIELPDAQPVEPERAESPKLSAEAAPQPEQDGAGIERANAARKAQIEQRRKTLAHLLSNDPEASTGELSDKLSVSPNTIRSDRRAIEAAPQLYVNGTANALG
jgi:DNA-binding CsgD family transcriptional regulator